MRNALTLALVFAAGVLLSTWWSGQSATLHAVRSAVPAATSAPAQSGTDADAPIDNGDRWPDKAPTPEQVLYAQPRLMRQALDELGPRVPGKPNLYLLAFAGDGGEDVFRNEAEYAAQLFKQRFGASTHSLVLENNPASLTTHPLASWSNLDAALDGLNKAMQPDDILLLYVSSHGSEDHELLVDMDPLPLDQISASDLAGILALHPFKWKVVVINACYSGGFVPPLRGPGTLVLTAARSDRSSFGCGSDSDITYFGKAWLVDALNHSDNFVDAFHLASNDIASWEQQDKLTPSVPQIDIGSGIQNQLALWRKGITPGPPVPFQPTLPTPSKRMP
ncbi:C13 family peptidase [Rhodanobacter sp. AS-Z3]|uniref:C13 family peptidase n=1 Tax=Rhodanobacter sp. AS-Z3 TaxID=3031330 RepID=UPI00247ABCDF|nr:C13 family peptidase [Rhodanobacter sp. AS-Z3]WEN13435.1 C13 family peptidase [Rhodanobacter sp. AS-Z3]